MFSTIQSKIILAMGVAIVLLGAAGYLYWRWSDNEIRTLEKNNAKLEDAVKLQKDTIKALDDAQVKQAGEILRLQLNQNAADTNYRDDVTNIYQIDIPAMSRKDLKATEDKINADTRRMLNEIETATQPVTLPKENK